MKYRRWVFFRYFKWAIWILETATPAFLDSKKSTSPAMSSSIPKALSFLCSGVLTRPKAMSCKWSLAMFLTSQLKSCFIQCVLISLQLGDLEGNRSAGFRRDENETHGVLALWILVVGRLLSYREDNSSGAMLNFGRVKVQFSFSQWHHLLRLPESNRTGEK